MILAMVNLTYLGRNANDSSEETGKGKLVSKSGICLLERKSTMSWILDVSLAASNGRYNIFDDQSTVWLQFWLGMQRFVSELIALRWQLRPAFAVFLFF